MGRVARPISDIAGAKGRDGREIHRDHLSDTPAANASTKRVDNFAKLAWHYTGDELCVSKPLSGRMFRSTAAPGVQCA